MFESRLATCSGIFDQHSLARKADRDRLQSKLKELANKLDVMQTFTIGVTNERKEFDALPKAQQKPAINDAIKDREVLATRVNGLNLTGDTVLQDLAMASMDEAITGHPIMTYTLSVQDIQINKKRFLLNNKITYQGTAEVVYQVTNTNGEIIAGDAISETTDAYDTASMRSANSEPARTSTVTPQARSVH